RACSPSSCGPTGRAWTPWPPGNGSAPSTRRSPGSPRASWRSRRCCPSSSSAPTRRPTTGPSHDARGYPDRRVGEYPRADSVEILMSVSEPCWHGMPMSSSGGNVREPAEVTWVGESVVIGCVIVALLPLGVLHLSSIGSLDPRTAVISDYVFQPGGYALLG